MRRIASLSSAIVLASLFAVALWFRVTRLERMPFADGDEAWYAVPVAQLLKGHRFEGFPPDANPLNPLFSGMPIPAVVRGVLAVVLTYILGRKIFDRTTARIASALPVAILCSKTAR